MRLENQTAFTVECVAHAQTVNQMSIFVQHIYLLLQVFVTASSILSDNDWMNVPSPAWNAFHENTIIKITDDFLTTKIQGLLLGPRVLSAFDTVDHSFVLILLHDISGSLPTRFFYHLPNHISMSLFGKFLLSNPILSRIFVAVDFSLHLISR